MLHISKVLTTMRIDAFRRVISLLVLMHLPPYPVVKVVYVIIMWYNRDAYSREAGPTVDLGR